MNRCPCGYQAASPAGLRWHLAQLLEPCRYGGTLNFQRVTAADLGLEIEAVPEPPPSWTSHDFFIWGNWGVAAVMERELFSVYHNATFPKLRLPK